MTRTRAALHAMVIAGPLVVLGGAIAFARQGQGVGHRYKPTPDEIAAFEAAKPVFEHHCFLCHTTAGSESDAKALARITMDDYPFGGNQADDAGSVVRKVLGIAGRKPTMPKDKPGAVSGDELARVRAWADAYDAARRASKENSHEQPASERVSPTRPPGSVSRDDLGKKPHFERPRSDVVLTPSQSSWSIRTITIAHG